MPVVTRVLWGALQSLLGSITIDNLRRGIHIVAEAVINLTRSVETVANAVDDIAFNAKIGEAGANAWVQEAGRQIAQMGADVKTITEHTYNTVIPHSLSWLDGYISQHELLPLKQRIGADESHIRFLLGWRSQIDTWRHKHVDPHIKDYEQFRKWFNGWPIKVLNTWEQWFKHPNDFAQWATPPLVDPIIAYLADSKHKTARDHLSVLMTAAWHDDVSQTWDALLELLVTNT